MKLKKFSEYTLLYSRDPRTFEKRVIFASPDKYAVTMFEEVNSEEALVSYPDRPIILWNGMSLKSNLINENRNHIFNQRELPIFKQIIDDLEGASFLPKSTKNRSEVKGLTFPIIGQRGNHEVEFKTYGKFKKSEEEFDRFRERMLPLTRFDVIAFKKNPIHIQERINQIGFDVEGQRFPYIDQIEESLKKIDELYSPDFYQATFIDTGKKLYLESTSTSSKLSPSQLAKMYEIAYENHYEIRLPGWFKQQIFENHIKPYYSTRYFDSVLLKPKHAIDFKKYSIG